MKPTLRPLLPWLLASVLVAVPALRGANPPVEAVSVADPTLPRSASAGGDSLALALTPDGAFVLFTSTAGNLVTNDHSTGFIDLFLRCRTNGAITLVSANATSTGGGNGDSVYASVTPDGRYVVFQSDASNLVTNDTNQASDVFVRDIVAGTTTLVSVNQSGTVSGNGPSSSPMITPDGRYVAFLSAATDLVNSPSNYLQNVFVRDLQTGVTTLVGLGVPGVTWTYSDDPVITPDGRFVAFTSSSSAGSGVYWADLSLGQTTRVSTNDAASPVLSDDGRFLAFNTITNVARLDTQTGTQQILSTNLIYRLQIATLGEMTPDGRFVVFVGPVPLKFYSTAIWLWDAQTGNPALVSVNLSGQSSTDSLCDTPAVSPDGRYVTFLSDATDLVTNVVNGDFQVYVRDMQTGTTRLASADAAGNGSGDAEGALPALSSDGRFVLFDSRSDVFAPGDLNDAYDVFVRDMAGPTNELISARDPSTPMLTANNSSAITGDAVSADGRLVVFVSLADNLVPGDTNGLQDVFVRDLVAGTNALVSVNRFGGNANGASRSPSLSANGRYVVFVSAADDLVANDTNRMEDVFVRDLVAGTTALVSVGTSGGSGNLASSAAAISADGRWVAFESAALNLVPGTPSSPNIFVRDLASGATALVGTNYAGPPLISPDGRFVVIQGTPPTVRDLQTGAAFAIASGPLPEPANALAFSDNSRVFGALCGAMSNLLVLTDLIAGTNNELDLGPRHIPPVFATPLGLSLSYDGRFAAFSWDAPLAGVDTNGVEDVFVYDALLGSLTLVSTNASGVAGNGRSYAPHISSAGRYVVFRSVASDLVPGDANGTEDIFQWDRTTGQITALSRGLAGGTGNGISTGLAFAPDARQAVFNSAASDLVSGDFNGTLDVFAVAVGQTAPPNPPPTLTATASAGAVKISWTATSEWTGRLQYKNALDEPTWHDVPGIVHAADTIQWMTDPTAAGVAQRFYRLLLVQ